MKTTMTSHSIANPRRTKLAELTDAGELAARDDLQEHATELPTQTANPRRTILNELPTAPVTD